MVLPKTDLSAVLPTGYGKSLIYQLLIRFLADGLNIFPQALATATSSPGPSPRRFSKWRIFGRRPWQRLGHVVQNLQKSWRFLSRDILRKAKTKWRQSITWEGKYRSKNPLTLYTRQWWLRSKIKYYFNGCFDSGAGRFSICKFIPLSYSLYF